MRAHVLVAGLVIAFAGSASLIAAQQQSETPKPETTAIASNAAPAATPAGTAANSKPGDSAKAADAPAKAPATVKNEPMYDRIEGEKRFRANCSRCHQAPHKFAPREMATIIRHMRVRATITDEDMRLILKYMTQ